MDELVRGRLYTQMTGRCVCALLWETVENVNNRRNEITGMTFVCIKLMRCKSEINAVLVVKKQIALVLSVLISKKPIK